MTLEYLAGIIDGEGSIQAGQKAAYRGGSALYTYAYLCVINTNKELIDRIAAAYGGKVRSHATKSKLVQGLKPCWIWNISGRSAIEILRQVFPFLIVKREVAACAIAMPQGRQLQ